ncbi:rod shape-determining protein RodA [[Bacillus] enclensis]|uniref:Rod shape determining protein RodA n=1 Tax=[Bacillus] enclensis TaxID=1402860 RepID=A0A0V8H6H6_9BACI|nr:FtsW/RodA/SpoVE family cell cycle protein [[Bacillus] enclensis]KSU58073.1 rod shape-determining protein RodA [[Bacillus] enclensis]SCC35542.1 rod shape determining protein RodA [[Bacillus] enclensis]
METRQRFADKFDWGLLFLLMMFFIVSALGISSAQTSGQYETNFVIRQAFWYVVGGIIIGGALFFDSDQYKRLAWYMYGFGIFLLLVLLISPESIAPYRNGAKSWFMLGPLGSIQPSEFMKTFLIIALARVITNHNEVTVRKTLKSDFQLLLKIGFTTLLPLAFIMQQPDLGTSLVILAIMTGIILVSGITWKLIVPIYAFLGVVGGILLSLVIWAPEFLEKYTGFEPYQFGRIYAWLDPYNYSKLEGFHLINSLNAIGSGQIFGKGYGDGEVYIPENHTDFIFSVIGEEYGFIGASVVISLFFLLIYHLTKTALDTKEPFNAYVCAGIISMITFHVFQNIGMTIQLLPITGIPLPFISYGGSSLMGNMLALGLVFSMRYHHKTYMFSSEES